MTQINVSMEQSDSHIKLIIKSEFASWPTLLILNKHNKTKSHTSTSMDLKPSTRIKPKSKSGLKNTILSWLQIQLQNKSPNCWVTSWSK